MYTSSKEESPRRERNGLVSHTRCSGGTRPMWTSRRIGWTSIRDLGSGPTNTPRRGVRDGYR